MFNKILASIGIGAAKVDTRIDNPRVRAGDSIKGEVHIKGGSIEQIIENIYMYLYTEYIKEVNDNKIKQKEILMTYNLGDKLVIKPGEQQVLPFQFTIPDNTPVSINRQKTYLSTGLDIEMAIDPTDLDPLHILPHPTMQAVFDVLDRMGFKHSYDSGRCEYRRGFGRLPFVQEFELKPTAKYRTQLDELELIFTFQSDGVQVFMEVDKRARGLGGLLLEAMDLDEHYVRFRISHQEAQDLARIEQILTSVIERAVSR